MITQSTSCCQTTGQQRRSTASA